MRDIETSWIARWARRAALGFRRRDVEVAMDDEMRYHIEREIAERIERGMTPDDARRAAMRDFGAMERHKEDARDARGLRTIEDAVRDARYAFRVLRRNSGFALAVVATFALGIGCTTSIFTLVRGILLRPLPYAAPDQLMALWERNASRGAERNVVSAPTFDAWRRRARSFSDVAAMVPLPRTVGGDPPERVSGAQVSASFFRVLGVRPALGRDFEPGDEAGNGASVVILSDKIWRTRFGADPRAVGRTLTLDGDPHTIIGVMPAGFDPPQFGWMTEYPWWVPFAVTESNRNWGRFLHVIGRRRAGVSTDAARRELARIASQLVSEGAIKAEWSATAVPLTDQIVGDVRRPLLILFGTAALLYLMSAVNVAGLLATFTRRRENELAVRRAMGATQFRLLRQQLVQSLVLGAIGSAAGVAIAAVTTWALTIAMPPDVPRIAAVGIDRVVLTFAVAVAVITMIIIGGVTARRASRPSPIASGTRATSRLGGASIVVAEIALGLVLSAVAALMVRTFVNLRAVDLGFTANAVVTGRVSLSSDHYPSAAAQGAFFDGLLARLRAMPGVEAASIATTRPFACCAPSTTVSDAAQGDKDAGPTTDVRFVDDAYFGALRVRVLAGHVFSSHEATDGPPRVVVSRALARTFWGDANPIGRRVLIQLFGTMSAEVIGVVADVHLADSRSAPRPEAFLSTSRFPSTERDVIVRGAGDATALLGDVRRALAAQDASVPLYRATALGDAIGQTLAQDRFTTLLLAGFAALALALASVGVYGVLAGDVARRRKELGIRLALGAGSASVMRLVLGRVVPPAVAGAVIGLAGAALLTRSMSALVFGIGATDPLTFALVALLLVVVAVLATLGPAFRATRVPAIDVIRAD